MAPGPLLDGLSAWSSLRSVDHGIHPEVILIGMTHTVGAKGQVVIPKDLRDRFGIQPGDEVSFWDCEDHVALRPVRSPETLRGRFRGLGLVEDLETERQADRRRESRR